MSRTPCSVRAWDTNALSTSTASARRTRIPTMSGRCQSLLPVFTASTPVCWSVATRFSLSITDPLIHSFRLFLQRLFKSTATQRRSRHSTDAVSEFHAEAPQATASEGLAQGPYVAARAGVEPTTLRSIGVDSANEPPCPTRNKRTIIVTERLCSATRTFRSARDTCQCLH